MRSFEPKYFKNFELPVASSWLIGACAEARGGQEALLKAKPDVLSALRELAIVQSAESSNRIEGVVVESARLNPLLQKQIKPRDRSEEEVLGYRKALDWIHAKHHEIPINSKTIRHLHKLAQSGSSGDAGEWKKRNNEIIEIKPDGRREVRFVPLAPKETPGAVDQLCLGYADIRQNLTSPDLLAVAAFVLDFLCIHPFRDGNGRVSRLLSLLLLYQCDYQVGRYIGLERVIEESKIDYYDALKKSSADWHEGRHDLIPFLNFFLRHIKDAYAELAERVSIHEGYSGGTSELIRQNILAQPGSFTLKDIVQSFKSTSPQLVKKVLYQLQEEKRVKLSGRGRGARWKVSG